MDELINGEIIEAGNLKLFVPAGRNVVTGNNLGEADDNQIWLYSNPPSFTDYYWFILGNTSANIDNNIRMTESINNGSLIENFSLAGYTWSGVYYDYHSIPCYMLKGTGQDGLIQATVIGHEINSDEVRTVLGSLQINA